MGSSIEDFIEVHIHSFPHPLGRLLGHERRSVGEVGPAFPEPMLAEPDPIVFNPGSPR